MPAGLAERRCAAQPIYDRAAVRVILLLFVVGLAAACVGTSGPSASLTATQGATPSTVPIPIPDIPSGEPMYGVGQPITVGDTVFTFSGLATRPDGLYATFAVQRGGLDGAQLLAGSALLPLRSTADGYEAGPIDLTFDPATDHVALVVGDAVVPLAPGVDF
jgi:hypothetical protein